MKFLKSAALALFLFAPSLAFAQTQIFWSPTAGFTGRDGGNDVAPIFPLEAGAHGVATINFSPLLVTTFGATWGTVNNSDTQGSDTDFTVNFTTGTGALYVVGATVFTINFSQPWSAATQNVADGGAVPMFGGQCFYLGPAAGTPGVSTFYLLPASATTATVIGTTAFTPANATTYHFGCHVFNLGAAY